MLNAANFIFELADGLGISQCPGAILFAIYKSLRLKAVFNTTLRETVMMMVF